MTAYYYFSKSRDGNYFPYCDCVSSAGEVVVTADFSSLEGTCFGTTSGAKVVVVTYGVPGGDVDVPVSHIVETYELRGVDT